VQRQKLAQEAMPWPRSTRAPRSRARSRSPGASRCRPRRWRGGCGRRRPSTPTRSRPRCTTAPDVPARGHDPDKGFGLGVIREVRDEGTTLVVLFKDGYSGRAGRPEGRTSRPGLRQSRPAKKNGTSTAASPARPTRAAALCWMSSPNRRGRPRLESAPISARHRAIASSPSSHHPIAAPDDMKRVSSP